MYSFIKNDQTTYQLVFSKILITILVPYYGLFYNRMKAYQNLIIMLVFINILISLLFIINHSQQQYWNLMLNNIKEIIKQLDFFEHPSLLRYQTQPGYRTLTGGVVSVAIIIIFAILFANKVIFTLTNMIPSGQSNVVYQTDPTYHQLKTNAADSRFMFAVGITGLDLNTQRYFDIQIQTFSTIRNVTGQFQTAIIVPMKQCESSQWTGVNDDISSAFNTLNFSQWLCPPQDYIFPLQGKYTSSLFKYTRIMVQKCGITSNSSTCANSTQIGSFIEDYGGVTANVYYINPIINEGDIDYLNYYLQDRNYFTFNTATGITANLQFSDYTIETDHSIFPWEDTTEDQGTLTSSPANIQTYTVTSNNQYARIYLRKSSQTLNVSRSFAKIDQTLAFIGGLLGFFLLLLTFMNVYTKFCYEIEFGDRIFKQNSNGTFGSQNFNFIVFLGYGLYNILTIFGIYLKWYTMRKYHECRIECIKQLDLHLLFKKIQFFEEVANIVLQDHHIKGIFMLPKKKINDSKKSRRKFLLQSLIYHQLDRKARQVLIEQGEYKKRYHQFLKQKDYRQQSFKTGQQNDDEIKKLKMQCSQSYKKLKDQSYEGQRYSKKIVDKMGMKQILTAIFQQFKKEDLMGFQGTSIKIVEDENNIPDQLSLAEIEIKQKI